MLFSIGLCFISYLSTTSANDVDQNVLTESKQQRQTQQYPHSAVLNISVNKCNKK
jgi:hypothetical protein